MNLFFTLLFATCALAHPKGKSLKFSFVSDPLATPLKLSEPPAGRGWGGDEKTETLPIEVIKKEQDYEIRKLPAAKWACTKLMDVDPLEDPMRNWREKYGDDPKEVMTEGTEWKKGPSSTMFKKLFRYILGVNTESKEIAMTRPVLSSVVTKENNLMDLEMCFWLGTPYETKFESAGLGKIMYNLQQAPEPIDKTVTIEERPSMVFYASQFNGHMFSHQDWESKYQDLKNTLSADDTLTPNPNIWYHIGYDSPWTPAEKRRNEIWIPQGQVDEANTQIARGGYLAKGGRGF